MTKLQKKLDYLQKAYNLPIDYAKKLIKPKFIIKKINVKNIMKNKENIEIKVVSPSLSENHDSDLELSVSQYEHELIDLEELDKLDKKIDKILEIGFICFVVIIIGLIVIFKQYLI